MEKQHGLLFNLMVLAGGIILLLTAQILGMHAPADDVLPKLLRSIGTGMTAYAPLRLLIRLATHLGDRRKAHSINRLFSGSVRVAEDDRELPLLLVSDVEGCVTPPFRTEIDLVKLSRLRRYCEFAKQNKQYPQLIFFTGRSQGYAELLAQTLGLLNSRVDIPFVIENGAALYQPTARKTIPLVSREQVFGIMDVRRVLETKYPENEFEPKSFMISINPVAGQTVDELRERVTLTLTEGGAINRVAITSTASAVDISPKGVGKLSGVREVLKYVQADGVPVSIDRVVGFGDQVADLEVLKAVGRAYCPAEYAHAEVRNYIEKKFGEEHVLKLRHVDFVVAVIERECGLKIT